jgi:hypothetical protein
MGVGVGASVGAASILEPIRVAPINTGLNFPSYKTKNSAIGTRIDIFYL